MGHDHNSKRRRRVAKYVERATVPETPFRHGPRYLVHPDVTAGCTPSLLAIATLLRDDAHPTDAVIIDAVVAFIMDGASPFFGRDTDVARLEAARLQELVVRGECGRSSGRTARAQPFRLRLAVSPA